MPLAETLHGEAGDDRAREVEIQKLNEWFYVSDDQGPDLEENAAPGEISLHHVNKLGALTFHRAGITKSRTHIN